MIGKILDKNMLRDLKRIESDVSYHLSEWCGKNEFDFNELVEDQSRLFYSSIILLAGGVGDYKSMPLISLSVCMELLNYAISLHKYPVGKKYMGYKIPLLVGDYLYSKSLEIMKNMDLSLIEVVMTTIEDIVKYQVEITTKLNQGLITQKDYNNNLLMNYTVFMGCCCKLSGMISGLEAKHSNALGEYGVYLDKALKQKLVHVNNYSKWTSYYCSRALKALEIIDDTNGKRELKRVAITISTL